MFDCLKSTNCFEGVVGGHFVTNITIKKILDVGYWWPTLFKDIHDLNKSCDNCHFTHISLKKEKQLEIRIIRRTILMS
jgi:hypothetical protein